MKISEGNNLECFSSGENSREDQQKNFFFYYGPKVISKNGKRIKRSSLFYSSINFLFCSEMRKICGFPGLNRNRGCTRKSLTWELLQGPFGRSSLHKLITIRQ